ncbi:Beta-hexosaminidase subunit beta [Temnothorax longispinosus]|uniref:beta-N-acetylhexosaminidase n=1 Tax=Temnothorax longispinosus TaxID=300112 RepID=A0A4S2KM86_9HYME|nr:Beta-hexosaminidase subunit beta [Temnothorax longispinosus]
MWSRVWIALALVAVVPWQVSSLHSDAGPWVQATRGELWPLPKTRIVKEDFYLLRPSNFDFRVIGDTCDIVTEAIERYTRIILTEARIARLVTEGQPRTSVRDDPHFKGTLEALSIRLLQPCEQNGEHWPHLYMNETYKLDINETSSVAVLWAESVWGILRGFETFSQILAPSGDGPSLKVKCQTILDGPKLPHRGLLLDTSRHYLPLSDILLTLDAMSYNKLNVLHWHIVDDNSFPYQSTSYPDLSAKGAYHHSMIYTPNDVQKVVDYARLRGIRVMPEFDTPGHTRSWGLAYPELLTTCYDSSGKPNGKLGPMDPTNPALYDFVRNLFSEIVQVFPDQYLHLGGDEVPFDCWASNLRIVDYMKARNMSKKFELLENEYIAKLLTISNSLDANTIVWQEVFDNGVVLPSSTVVHVWKLPQWQKELERATMAGHPVLLSSCWYLDHIASGGDWEKYYNCDPFDFVNAGNATHLMLGGETCMWAEFVDKNNVHPRIWPRASAAAERLWSFNKQDNSVAARRLEEHACRMNRRGIPAQPPNGSGFCIYLPPCPTCSTSPPKMEMTYLPPAPTSPSSPPCFYKNSGHKESSARPSAASLQSTTTSHHHQRRSRSVKLPSVQNLHNSNSSDKVARFKDERMVLPDEMQPPKTRFISQSKSKEAHSTSSPRLKSFPAEEIKKLDNPPMFSPEPIAALIVQQDPRETGTFYTNSSARNNNGHGDAISVQLSHQQSKPQTTCSTSQQQVVANHQEICQTNPHSESLLTQRIASPEKQAHRPFVPNILQEAVIYDRSHRIPSAIINQPVITQTPSTRVAMPQAQESSSDSRAVVDQNRNESSMLENQYQKQPISDRNAANYRQMYMQMQQQKQATIVQNANVSPNDQTANNCQNIYHAQFRAPFQQNLHQINQQTQHSAYNQQMLPRAFNQMQPISNQQQHIPNNSGIHCSHYNQQLPITQSSGQGMTSPQDMTVNQMRLMRHNLPVHQQNRGYPVSFQPAWPQNDRWMQVTNQNQQHLHQQLPWQYYYQAHDANFNQQNSGSQNQSNPSQNQANHKLIDQSIAEAHGQQKENKTLHFTSDMIRDQELLVSTMRQQGVPEEVMRRQFDALLNEQKRHLAYIAQFQQQKLNIPEEIKRNRLARRRTEKDEKPEWMIHITPPRISYSDIERMNAQQRALNEQYLMDDKSGKIIADQQRNYHQLKKEKICNQVSPQQTYVQMNPYQVWQAANWPYRGDHQTCGHTACYPYNHQQSASNNVCQPTFKYAQYPNMRYNPYFPHSESQYNPSSLNPLDNQRTSMDPTYFYQQNRKPTETSSLLKMRVYKEIICPQKRNNGLQDPDNIQKMLEALKDPTSRKGLEYLANLAKRKPIVRLNGIQNSNEIPEDMQPRPSTETPSQSQKRIPANGLENSRNPNNPPSRVLRPKKADEPLMAEYPRQRQNARNCYSMQAEKENGTMATLQNQGAFSYAHGSIPYNRQNIPIAQGCHGNNNMILQYGEGAPPRHCHQMQQYYLNGQNLPGHNGGQGDVACIQQPDAPGATRIDRAGGDTGEKSSAEEAMKRIGVQTMQATNAYGQPEIRETRTIGGITYLARKPECTLNNLVVSPDRLIASEHMQTPRIF